jgi:hypothetical protein
MFREFLDLVTEGKLPARDLVRPSHPERPVSLGADQRIGAAHAPANGPLGTPVKTPAYGCAGHPRTPHARQHDNRRQTSSAAAAARAEQLRPPRGRPQTPSGSPVESHFLAPPQKRVPTFCRASTLTSESAAAEPCMPSRPAGPVLVTDHPSLTDSRQQLQSDSCVSSATPRMIQWLAGMSVGNFTNMTKLVEWPVVASTPRRSAVR